MFAVFFNQVKSVDGLLENPYFKLYDSYFTIRYKGENVIFRVDSVSNVRCLKKRNFTINFVLLFSTLLSYSLLADYLHKNIYNIFFMFVIFTILSVISLSIKNYTNVLLIDMGPLHFKEFTLSKKQNTYAKQFVSTFKSKYRNNKYQNDLDFLNVNHSS
jgi:hypothetical protein